MREEEMFEEAWGVEPEVIEREGWQVAVVWLMGRDYVVLGAKVARSKRYGLWLGKTPLGELVVGRSLRTVVAELIRRSCWEEREKWEELARAVEEGRADVEVWPEDKYFAWLKCKVLAGMAKPSQGGGA
jgi:hypothetical protein